MLLFNIPTRRLFLLGSLAACGFKPVLSNKAAQSLWGKVELPDAKDAIGFTLRKSLAKYFGEPTMSRYRLEMDYSFATSELAVAQNSIVTRYRSELTGTFRAILIEQNKPILNQKFKRVGSYSANSDRFASVQAKEATETRLIEALADDFAIRFINAVAQDIPTKL